MELATTRIESAVRALGASQSREREENSKLQVLVGYRDEYRARFATASRQGLDRRAWTNYHEFMAKLEEAIKQQQALLARYRNAVEQCRVEWLTASGRLKSIDTLDQRRRQAERTIDRRREQRVQNEHAARKPARSN